MNDAPRVTIAGGGLAGLTAALRLAERGYPVKLYEQQSWLGGDIGSRVMPDGRELDVYPHMYLSWYHNFWQLLEDVGAGDRDDRFQPFSGVKQLRRGQFPKFDGIAEMYSRRHMVQNLFSGVGSPADMFVFGYASIDLLAERVNPTMPLENMSVTGFMQARPYMTDRAAAALDSFITTVWAIPGYKTAADDYRTYLDYCVGDHEPAFWLAKGSALRLVVEPIVAAAAAAGVEIVRSVQVTKVTCTGGRVTEIELEGTAFDPDVYTWVSTGEPWTEPVDELILAVPPAELSSLVRSGESSSAVVDEAPRLAEVSRLRSERIPVLHLFFNRKLRNIPAEPVSMFESRYALAFTDISQSWEGASALGEQTVLSLSASDPYELPGTGYHEDAMAMIIELARFLDFDPGTEWGESEDIDWKRTRNEPNTDAQLFVNETGTTPWRPPAACGEVENLSFAGDFCANRIGMTTIESAVVTGLEAARTIVERRHIGAPVEILEPRNGSGSLYLWVRYAWGPYAYAAKAWSAGSDGVKSAARKLTDLLDQRR